MATTSLWAVRRRLDHIIEYVVDEKKTIGTATVIAYTTDKDKTLEQKFVTCVNCFQQCPYESMRNTKRLFHDEREIVCYHGYQSFVEGEVTAEKAHQIGVELANKVWGNRFEVVITTHLNTNHIHNHFVVNATSFVDGKRFCNTKKDIATFRFNSDELCRQYGLSVIEQSNHHAKSRRQYQNEKSLRDKVRMDIDDAITISNTETQFFQYLEYEGYEVRISNHHISLKHPNYEKAVRLTSLGDGYSREDIKLRLLNHDVTHAQIPTIYERKSFDITPYYQKYKKKQLTGFQRQYLHFQYMLGIIPKPRKSKYTKEQREVMRHIDEISNQTILICKYELETIEQLNDCETVLQRKLDELINKRQLCYNKIRRCSNENKVKVYKEVAKSYTPQISKLRKEIKLCNGIRERSIMIKGINMNLVGTNKGEYSL